MSLSCSRLGARGGAVRLDDRERRRDIKRLAARRGLTRGSPEGSSREWRRSTPAPGPPREEFVQALLEVRLAAVGDPELGVAGIAGDTGFTPGSRPPGDDDPVGQALYRVSQAALDIGATVDGYLYPAGAS